MLGQAEADSLLAMSKRFEAPPGSLALPAGRDQTHDLVATAGDERFLLDLSRGRIKAAKLKFQTRAQVTYVLARLDIDGAPHTNPDGTRMGGTHIHLYRAGYEDQWAHPLDATKFADPTDAPRSLADFCRFCAIQEPPPLSEGLAL